MAERSDIVLVALPSGAALHDAVAGPDGLVEGAASGLIVVEMSTLPIAIKQEARQALASAGAITIDAPVSGTGLQADAAEVVVYASGDPDALARVSPVFEVIAKATYDLGDFGNGSKMKFVANLLVSVHNLTTAKAFVLGAGAGPAPARSSR